MFLHYLLLYFEVWSIYLSRTFNKRLYVEYLTLTCLRAFLEDLLIHSVAFPFRVLILYSKFTQSPFVLINRIHFLKLKICPKYLTEILKILTESFFNEIFSPKHFPPKLFVINAVYFLTLSIVFSVDKQNFMAQ